jgi:hypothetical protein
MNPTTFLDDLNSDPQTSALLQAIAKDIAEDETEDLPPSFSLELLTPFAAMGAYALYRFFKNRFDHKRGVDDLDLVREQVTLVKELEADGIARDKAEKSVAAMLKQVRDRGGKDSAVQMIAGWFQLGKK